MYCTELSQSCFLCELPLTLIQYKDKRCLLIEKQGALYLQRFPLVLSDQSRLEFYMHNRTIVLQQSCRVNYRQITHVLSFHLQKVYLSLTIRSFFENSNFSLVYLSKNEQVDSSCRIFAFLNIAARKDCMIPYKTSSQLLVFVYFFSQDSQFWCHRMKYLLTFFYCISFLRTVCLNRLYELRSFSSPISTIQNPLISFAQF